MKTISRHAVDVESARKSAARKQATFADLLDAATDNAGALSIILGSARSYAGYLAAADGKTPELCRALRIGAQAAAAIFALGSGSGAVEFAIGDVQGKLPATGATDATHPGNWRIGWWLAHIVADRAAIDRLVATPIDVLRRSSSRGDECQYLFIEALQGFEERSPDWSSKLRAALDSTDPETVKLSDDDFVLNILVPEMQMLFRLALGEIGPFNESLLFALERHKKYWSRSNRKQDPDGYLALGPLAIASLASDAGIPVEVESQYLPFDLIRKQ